MTEQREIDSYWAERSHGDGGTWSQDRWVAGQVSLHIPQAERIYEPTPRRDWTQAWDGHTWDGHTTEEKMGRLRAALGMDR
jgi:hypothetical protein